MSISSHARSILKPIPFYESFQSMNSLSMNSAFFVISTNQMSFDASTLAVSGMYSEGFSDTSVH